jgi:hypothetical protein
VDAVIEGAGWRVPVETCDHLFRLFRLKIDVPKEPVPVVEFMDSIFKELAAFKGVCWKLMS